MSGSEESVLRAVGVSKTFVGRTVLRDFHLDLKSGEVHGLLGENGSGKSTFIKVLSAYHAPDPGAELRVRGREVRLPMRATDPAELGIGFVHQDLALLETASVLENVRVGRYATGFGWRVSWRRERAVVAKALADFGLDISPDQQIATLGPVERAMVAIVRALGQVGGTDNAVLVLDEPTAYLPRDGVDRLFDAIRHLAARGLGVLFVTHRLEEVRAITDRVTVLRDGALVANAETASLTEAQLIETILGFELTDLYPDSHEHTGAPVLEVQDAADIVLKEASLTLRKGEIVGVTGLAGMGFEELPYVLFGAGQLARGTVTFAGVRRELSDITPRMACDLGMALVPGNRARDSVVPDASVAENMSMVTLRRHFRGGVLRHRAENATAGDLMQRFDVRPLAPRQRMETLSGGNQQKAILAKWLIREPQVLLMHEPTQGVDIGAKREIFRQIRSAADNGAAVLIAGTEYEDLANVCDRVLVFRHGRVVSELAGDSLTPGRVVEHALREAPTRTRTVSPLPGGST
jgi:ribose transport system ATP-binding protein